MALAALAILTSYVAVASVRPLLVTRWRAGTWAVRATPGAGKLIALLFPAANAAVCVGPVLDLTKHLARIGSLDHPVPRVVGIVVGVAGLPLIVVAQETMGASWRIGVDSRERTELVTWGMFRVSRNPIYAGMVAMAVGVALMVPNPISMATVVLYVLAVELQVRAVEEPYLRRIHGTSFAAWAATSGRFVPGVGKSG